MLGWFMFTEGHLTMHGFGGLVMLGQTAWTIGAGGILLRQPEVAAKRGGQGVR